MAKGMKNLLKQAQKMQSQMAKVQEELAAKTVEATVGGGMVTVVANGKQEIVSVTIDPEVATPEEVEMLQDLVVAAANEALRRVQEMVAEEMGKITGNLGINIPGLT